MMACRHEVWISSASAKEFLLVSGILHYPNYLEAGFQWHIPKSSVAQIPSPPAAEVLRLARESTSIKTSILYDMLKRICHSTEE